MKYLSKNQLSMPLKPRQINRFTLFKLPSAYFCGVRVKSISEVKCVTSVKYKWINQNPFRSMFWAVQGMAAELSTGALVMSCIRDSNRTISMLVVNNSATFLKKATGRINFTCEDGLLIKQAIKKTIETREGQTCRMKAKGLNSEGITVSVFEFEWTIKMKN